MKLNRKDIEILINQAIEIGKFDDFGKSLRKHLKRGKKRKRKK